MERSSSRSAPAESNPDSRPRSSRKRYKEFRAAYRAGEIESTGEDQETPTDARDPATVKRTRRRYFRQYVRWLWPHHTAVAIVMFISLITAGLEMLQPLFMKGIIDDVLLAEALTRTERYQRLHLIGAVFLAIIVVDQLLDAVRNYRQRQLNARVVVQLRRSVYDRLLRLPLESLADMKTGGILSRLSGDIDTTTGLLQMAIVSPGIAVVRLAIAIGILFALNWRLALTALAVLPGIMFISFVVARRIRPIYRAMRKDAAEVDARVSETFGGIRVVRAFQREVRELADYVVGRHTMLRKELFAHRRELLLWGSWGFMMACVNVVIIWYGGYLEISGNATIGEIMAFQWYTFLLLNPVWQIVNSFSELQRSLAATERVFEVLEMPEDKPDRPAAGLAPREIEALEFDAVSFSYGEGPPVIKDVSIVVPGSWVVALVGRSGSGKTTFTDLVARFYDPTSGQVRLNGTDIRDFQLDSYRQLLAVVQQEVFLFDGTVRENIAYGRPDATEAEVRDAAVRANAEEFILRLANQYDSIIGERGVKLSGGQCQRLSLARAILADPQILILDEATSNLDTESEQLIQASLADLLRGRTTFVIAHRLSTIVKADMILVLDDGQIVEQGAHRELLEKRGLYYAMVQRQQTAMDRESITDSPYDS